MWTAESQDPAAAPPASYMAAAEAMGGLIEHWGFKRIHGVLWSLLYLAGGAHTQASIAAWTGFSRGAISMALQELADWGVVRVERALIGRERRYVAETDLAGMLRTVLGRREQVMLAEARDRFAAAAATARGLGPRGKLAAERAATLRGLTDAAIWTLDMFLERGQLPLTRLRRFFESGLGTKLRGGPR